MSKQEIRYLEDHEHLLLRPALYIGSVEPSEEKVPVIRDGRLVFETRLVSVGMMKIFNEAVDNAYDVYKKNPSLKHKVVTVRFTSDTNRVDVIDRAVGFYKGTELNKKTGKTNIETAVSYLRAGSNFDNDSTEAAVIGTNGIGISATNILSDWFDIETYDGSKYFQQEWRAFKSKGPTIRSFRPGGGRETGTRVSFVPRASVFKYKWDFDLVRTSMALKRFLTEDEGFDVEFVLEWDGQVVDLRGNFLPKDVFVAKSKVGTLVVYETYEGAGSLSFVNTAMCTGIHQRIINEQINMELGDTLGHHFYETFVSLHLPPKLVKFGDQNKTKFVSTREEIQPVLKQHFGPKLAKLFRTDLFARIKQRVDERQLDSEVKKLRNMKKKSTVRNSAKYFPPSGRLENLFIVEGESAMGSILQKRDTKTDGVYSLKGKIKNVRTIGDLTANKEILDLMQIMDLDTDPSKRNFSYKRVIVSTDSDEDGAHIFCLITNFFYRWFPYIITEGRLFRLVIPLISTEGAKGRNYFYDKREFETHAKGKTVRELRFLKGLGSLDLRDWEFVMTNKRLLQVQLGDQDVAKKYMLMSFGTDAAPRKKWLTGRFR